MRLLLVFFCLYTTVVYGQSDQDLRTFANYFRGQWEADPAACEGIGSGTRDYELVLGSAYVRVVNHAEFPASDPGKEPGSHDDIGYFSFDNGRNCVVYRSFNSEGYVNQFVLDSISLDGQTLIFLSEALENAPVGWRSRLSITQINADTFDERFELAANGKDFMTYVKSRWVRK